MYSIIKVKDLMVLERILLEIDTKHKFDLSFENAYKTYLLLKDIGRLTNYFFLLQNEFYEKYNDIDKLNEYHKKLEEETINFEYDEIVKFIKNIQDLIKDENLDELVSRVKFWG